MSKKQDQGEHIGVFLPEGSNVNARERDCCLFVNKMVVIGDFLDIFADLCLSVHPQEQERSDLLEQYRHLSLEAERFETQANQLESEGSNLRLELMTLDSENHHLKERVQGLEREIQEVGMLH